MGWGPNNYSIELSPDANFPVTHHGCHAWVTEEFVKMIEDVNQGIEFPELVDFPSEHLTDVMTNLIVSFQGDFVDHFANVAAEHNLQVITSSNVDITL